MTTYVYKSTTGHPVNIDNFTITPNPGLQLKYPNDILDTYLGTSINRYDDGVLVSSDPESPVMARKTLTGRVGNILKNDAETQDVGLTVSLTKFGAKGDDVADDTAALQRAFDELKSGAIRNLICPPGIYRVDAAAAEFDNTWALSIKGFGQRSTFFKKLGSGTSPIITLSATGVIEACVDLSGFSVIGSAKGSHGLVIENLARFTLQSLAIRACDVGLLNKGSLVFSGYDATIQGNNTGYKSQKTTAAFCNLVQFFGGQISSNTTLGADIGEASGFHFHGVDLSANGTAANLATGAVLVRSNVDDESGACVGAFNGCWFENSKGMAVAAEASNVSLSFRDSVFLGSEGGNVMSVGDIRTLTLDNVQAISALDTVTVAAKNLVVSGGNIAVLTDNSTQSSVQNGTALTSGASKFRASSVNQKIGGAALFAQTPAILSKQYVAAGNIGTGEDDLLSYSALSKSFITAGTGFRVTAWGTAANNANTKTLKVYFAGTQIGTISFTASQANAWRIDGEVIYRGGNLWSCIIQTTQGGTVTKTDCIATTLAAIDPNNALVAKLTGEGVADSDVLARGMVIEYIG